MKTSFVYCREEIHFGTMKEHELSLSRNMIMNSPVLKPGDTLINDRGFLSREVLNELKTRRGVDSYIPLRKDMDAYEQAISLAKEAGKKKRESYGTILVDIDRHRIVDMIERRKESLLLYQ